MNDSTLSDGSQRFRRTHNVVIMPSQPCRFPRGSRSGWGAWSLVAPGWRLPLAWVRANWATWWAAFHIVLKWKVEPLAWRPPRCESNTDSSKSASRTAARPGGIRVCVGGVCSEGLAVGGREQPGVVEALWWNTEGLESLLSSIQTFQTLACDEKRGE